MSKSLQDQLLKAGIVDRQKAKKIKKDKHKKGQQNRNSNTEPAEKNKQAMEKVRLEKVERDRELNRKKLEKAKGNELLSQIRQLIESNRETKGDGEVPYNFVDDNKVKKIRVTSELQGRLARGQLSIVKLEGVYELVPAEVAERIRALDDQWTIIAHVKESRDEDDPYADHQIPDDLMW